MDRGVSMIAAKLRRGDEVRVVSPATSLGFIPEDQRETAAERRGPGFHSRLTSTARVGVTS